MIKARGTGRNGEPVVVLGLSASNIKRMREGKPMRIELSDLGLPPGRVYIFYEQDIVGDLIKAGIEFPS